MRALASDVKEIPCHRMSEPQVARLVATDGKFPGHVEFNARVCNDWGAALPRHRPAVLAFVGVGRATKAQRFPLRQAMVAEALSQLVIHSNSIVIYKGAIFLKGENVINYRSHCAFVPRD
jgi:hypothetical protein